MKTNTSLEVSIPVPPSRRPSDGALPPFSSFSPYQLVLLEIEKGKIDPFDVDLDYLISLFRETAKELSASDYMREAGRFLEATAKLLNLQIEEIFPKPKPQRRKITIKEVRDALVDTENNYEPQYDLSFMWDYSPKIGRPSGAKDRHERKLSWKEFWEEASKGVPLHKEVNYSELGRKIRKRFLKEGKIEIKTVTDFIAYLFAYFEFDDIPAINLTNCR